MCVNGVLEVIEMMEAVSHSESDVDDCGLGNKILDFAAGKGLVGKKLAGKGFSEIYGQEGSKSKIHFLRKMGDEVYKDVQTFIVGKQALPMAYRRKFDIVTCSGGLGTNLLPARAFEDMLSSLRQGGYVVFTVSQKHLSGDSNFGMGYFEAISKLIERKVWTPVAHHEFDKHQSYDND